MKPTRAVFGFHAVLARLRADASSVVEVYLDENRKDAREGLEALLDSLKEPPLLLVLDGVTDPHNLGACLRVAEAAGAHAVIAPKDRAARDLGYGGTDARGAVLGRDHRTLYESDLPE